MKFKEKQEVLRLRKQGISLRDIAKTVPVSRSTISRWSREVKLTEQQLAKLASCSATAGNQLKGAQARKEKAHKQRLEWQKEGEKIAKNADKFFTAICMLFWAEGSKDRNSVSFCNSDVDMMKFWMKTLTKTFAIQNNKIAKNTMPS